MLRRFTRQAGRRTTRRWAVPLMAAVLLVPLSGASALASVPNGGGLVGPSAGDCEELGVVAVIEPPGENDTTAWDINSGQHVVLQELDATFTASDGQVFTFHKTWGGKAGLETITCTGEFEEDGGTGQFTAVVAIVPPQ